MSSYEKSRPVRGLIILSRELYMPFRTKGRGLIANSSVLPREWGTCRWCREPSPSKRHLWHENCSAACHLAHGRITWTNDWLLNSPHWEQPSNYNWGWVCAECGKDGGFNYEVDHDLPISIAWQLRRLGARDWWKAWTFENLRPLCRDCHWKKTKVDKGRLAAIRKIKKGEINETINTHNYIDLLELP